jgi:hypothetical protein
MTVSPFCSVDLLKGGMSFRYYNDNNRKLRRSLDDTAKGSGSRESELSAFNMFRNMDRKGSIRAANEDTSLLTVHQNTVT